MTETERKLNEDGIAVDAHGKLCEDGYYHVYASYRGTRQLAGVGRTETVARANAIRSLAADDGSGMQ